VVGTELSSKCVKSGRLMELITVDGVSREALLREIYDVTDDSSERFRESALRNLSRMLSRMRTLGFNIASQGRIVFRRGPDVSVTR